MNILYILRHNPWGIGGGCYACRCYLDAFTEVFKGAHLDVCICEEYLNGKENGFLRSTGAQARELGVPFTVNGLPNKNKGKNNGDGNVNFIRVAQRNKMEKVLSPMTGLLHRFDSTARKMLESQKYDFCIFDHNSIAGPLVELCKKQGVKTIVINHNCEAEYYRDNYDWLHRMFFFNHVKRVERQSYLGCDYNIFLTEEDKNLFGQVYGKSSTRSVVTGCFEAPSNSPSRGEESLPFAVYGLQGNGNGRLRLVISGTIGNVQNMDGIQYFLDELLDCVPKKAEVVIAGKNPPEELKVQIEGLNREGHYTQVTLIPNPVNILEIVSSCDIFVCPTRLGGGLKLRVMDGLKAGLPVIAHQVSARGYTEFAKQGFLWAFDSKQGFADALHEVVQKRDDHELNRTNIQDFADQQFSFESKVEMLKNTIV